MLYFNRNGVWFTIPLKNDGVYSRELLEKQIHTSLLSLQNLKDRSPDLEQMRFEKPNEYLVTSVFGRDEIIINPQTLIEKEEVEIPSKIRKIITKIIPAIEVYDISGEFKGIVICESGTFNPIYTYIPFDSSVIDPFEWGQWQKWYGTRPYSGTLSEKVVFSGIIGKRNITVVDIPPTAEFLSESNADSGTSSKTVTWEPAPPEYYYICSELPASRLPLQYGCFRHEKWDYTYYEQSTYNEYYELLDTDGNYTGEIISASSVAVGTISQGNNSFIKGPSSANETGGCEVCIDDIEIFFPIATSPHPSLTYPTPSLYGPEILCFIWDSYTTIGYQDHISYDPTNSTWTTHESATKGGITAIFETELTTKKYDKDDGSLLLSDQDAVLEWDGCVRLRSPSTEVETQSVTWTEGALVDSVIYRAETGDGLYSSHSDKFAYYGVNPRYWGGSTNTRITFASSAYRNTSKNYVYYFIDHENRSLTATDFDYTHTLSTQYFHEIPGYSNLFGKGYFRLVRVTETMERELPPIKI